MAEDSFQEKTEQATPRKKDKAKKKGQVARSRDLSSMIGMGGIVLLITMGGENFFMSMGELAGRIFSMSYGNDVGQISRMAIIEAFLILMPFLLAPLVLGVGASVMQGGFVIKEFKIEFSKLNPLEGAKKMVSSKGMTELLKSLLKFAIGGWITYYVINKNLDVLPSLAAMELEDLMKTAGGLVVNAILLAFAYFLFVAIITYFLEKWQFEKSMKMTKQEVKEEHKETEGDPMIKSRIKSIQREAARSRMMQEVPDATVVVTNPTHLAIALKYIDGEMTAPQIVAKGAGALAAKIREIATENGVPIVEDKPVARALYKQELNSFIPEELYVAVAKILAYIYKLKGKI